MYIGNEAQFVNDDGLGDFGSVKVGLRCRAGKEGFQNVGHGFFNSRDADSLFGGVTVEAEDDKLVLRTTRWVRLWKGRKESLE